MSHRSHLKLIALACMGLPACAFALESDREKPIDFEAGHFDGVIAETGQTRLERGFVLTQGSLTIRSEVATIERKDGALVKVVLNGAPATVEQALDSGGRMHAEALDIDYDIGADVLLLRNKVTITQPEGSLQGELVRYEIGSGKIQGGGEGGRIRMRIEPKPKPAAAAPADASKPAE